VLARSDIGVVDFHAPAGATRSGTLSLYRWAAKRLHAGRTITVRLFDDGEDRPYAPRQAIVRLKLRIR
jgi:hypothetical protein